MDDVIKTWKPRYYMAVPSSHSGQTYLRLLRDVKALGIPFLEPKDQPRRIELGSVVLTVLPQPPFDPKEENDNSIGIRLDYGKFSMLMTGDSEEPSREWWEKNARELLSNCTVLKLAHHGSHNGTDQGWLDIIKPRVAVASLGTGNTYGHPHSEVVELLEANRIPFLRTDKSGTIVFKTDGRSLRIERLGSTSMASASSRGGSRATVKQASSSGRSTSRSRTR
jgi:beta-lactamase superfamily II metal-dependent hydrolase